MSTDQPDVRLIDAKGVPGFGLHPRPVTSINHADFHSTRPTGGQYGKLAKWLQYKQFQFFGGLGDDLVFGCALIDLHYLGAAFWYIHQPSSGRTFELRNKLPLARGVTLTSSPLDGTSSLRRRGRELRLEYRSHPRRTMLVGSWGEELAVEAWFEEGPDFQPLVLCTPTGATGWTYTQKAAGLPLSGTIRCPLGTFDLAAEGVHAVTDFTAGYLRRETNWCWASISGRMPTGNTLGLNLSCGVNETSFTENCFWLDGRLEKVHSVAFEPPALPSGTTWRITSNDGKVDLRFQPQWAFGEHLDLWLLASAFDQHFGRYDGLLHLGDGTRVEVRNLPGFLEKHYARW